VPLPGNNSPVVWGRRVFLSGADKTRREVYCFDADGGDLLWQREVPGTPQSTAKPPKIIKDTGYAAPTTATDGRRIFAIFANGDLAGFKFDGELAWARSLGMPDNVYGHASSLAMFENLLLVQFDQGGRKDQKSKLLALDAASGETVWQVVREVPNSWASPIVLEHEGRAQLITCADPWVIAYNPRDAAEIWRVSCLRQDVGPSPVYADGILYVVNEWPQLTAIRPDGQGDVTDTHVLWFGEDGLPNVASPLATKQFVFLLSGDTLTCYDAKQGGMLWEEYDAFADATFVSSPSLVGERVYLFGEREEEDAEGERVVTARAWIVEPRRDGCEIIGSADLDEGCVTSPAFQDGRFYLRGRKHLFCIGKS
jgi:outer membrane protein assembly factor BamB